jgi:regulator of protease activity HflC (stomatin/prohibitin superfamily)
MKSNQRGSSDVAGLIVVVILVAAVISALMFGLPMWNMWRAQKSGEAELAQANYTRQIATAEAKAKSESAIFLAEAEITRAKGAAQANQIIADGLGGPEGYLEYLKIQALESTKNQVIYIPTEASLPILEAGKRQ